MKQVSAAIHFNVPYYITGGDLWAVPDGWDTLHPELNLNLDDSSPYFLHGGAIHVATGVCQMIRVFL